MFDITAEDISNLNDVDLRELVARLCEAEVASRGHSTAAVTWGGHQDAPDGGLDVRVSLPAGASIDGFISRPTTGFQVKKPDMPKAAIINEMRPSGTIRPVIQDLTAQSGAYILVSSSESTSDKALENRRRAMRDALHDATKADLLYTDFYDRTRLASWTRCHSGLVAWVRAKARRAIQGWHPYGPWSNVTEGMDAEYLLDDHLALSLDRNKSAKSIPDSIDTLRDELARPRSVVRLVGLSGVGKTRFAQALFDKRVGSRSLRPSLAIYTNLSDNPIPQPIGLASDLIASRSRAILIVDNCPPDLHERLSKLCMDPDGLLSVMTIEYDIREDQPEQTRIVSLETSSIELIENLLKQRFSMMSHVDISTIAELSGGNSRIALALAEAAVRSGTISGLSSEEIFKRLFWQRHEHNDSLLRASQVLSLVYSFQGEALEGEASELPRLASLAGQSDSDLFRHVSELLRRNLAQQRGPWRAMLPHALANRLASRALEDIPIDRIESFLVTNGTDRLAKSFSRRLSFLHQHPKAVSIATRWLSPSGLLANLDKFTELGQAMFENIAPISPETTLSALERIGVENPKEAIGVWGNNQGTLRSIAYDPVLFQRGARLLANVFTQSTLDPMMKEARGNFISLFSLYLSGTHASIDQRISVLEPLLQSLNKRENELGLSALDQSLETSGYSSVQNFSFGSRPRDYGYEPKSSDEFHQWFSAIFQLLEHAFDYNRGISSELRSLFAKRFIGLLMHTGFDGDIERLMRYFSKSGFWREGWIACKTAIRRNGKQLAPDILERLIALESTLRPTNLVDRVRSMVLGRKNPFVDLEDTEDDEDLMAAHRRSQELARELGAAVAIDHEALTELLPELFESGPYIYLFGFGLATTSKDQHATWLRLAEAFSLAEEDHRDTRVLVGYLEEVGSRNVDLAHDYLDDVVNHPALLRILPMLSTAIGLDERSIRRLEGALKTGKIPINSFRTLAYGGIITLCPIEALRRLLLRIAETDQGFSVAVEIFSMRLHADRAEKIEHKAELLAVGRDLTQRIKFEDRNDRDDFKISDIVKVCLVGPESATTASIIAERMRIAMLDRISAGFIHDDLLTVLLALHPIQVLDSLFLGHDEAKTVSALLGQISTWRKNPASDLSPEAITQWCTAGPEPRHEWLARVVPFADRQSGQWSEQAKSLITSAKNPQVVLEALIRRFAPNSWSGSRAIIIEKNAQLLDQVDSFLPAELLPFAANAKVRLMANAARERNEETRLDRSKDEGFE